MDDMHSQPEVHDGKSGARPTAAVNLVMRSDQLAVGLLFAPVVQTQKRRKGAASACQWLVALPSATVPKEGRSQSIE
jgi:hypothetical protein